jgi:AcrR family transcriptional regulator
VAKPVRTAARRRGARKPRDVYHHGDLRRALVDAALALVAERGPVAWTLREAARRIGVTHNAPYRHFASREALLAAVAEEGFREFARFLDAADDAAPRDPLSRLRVRFRSYVRFARDNPAALGVMFSHELADRSRYPGLQEAAQEAFARLRDTLVLCQQGGVVRAGDPDLLALVAWSTVHGFSMLVLEEQLSWAPSEHERDALVEPIIATLLQGIGGPALERPGR